MLTLSKPFSLIELLMIVAILGIMVCVLMPGYNGILGHAKGDAARQNQQEIRSSFQRCAEDNGIFQNESRLRDIVQCGFWPLFSPKNPLNTADELSAYDAEYQTGWRGPYLQCQSGTLRFNDAELTKKGQNFEANKDGNRTIPVIQDPNGGYYRILCPDQNGVPTLEDLQRLCLVYTGENKTLETTPEDLHFHFSKLPPLGLKDYSAYRFDPQGNAVEQSKVTPFDDVILPLFPLPTR